MRVLVCLLPSPVYSQLTYAVNQILAEEIANVHAFSQVRSALGAREVS